MDERRLKHWGWGYEDQAPSDVELRRLLPGSGSGLGLAGSREAPCRWRRLSFGTRG